MPTPTRLLVVANRTVDSDDLLAALRERAAAGPVEVTLLVPQDSHGGLGHRLTHALALLEEAEIPAHGMLGDVDAAIAVLDSWDPDRYDELIVSTLPEGESRWMALGLPRRVEDWVHAPVTHVIAHEARSPAPMPIR